jgi:tagatose-1,6-bisphosphate aldolase
MASMPLGYNGKLYLLAFDHRGSFQKKMFGIQGDPTPEETATIADAKRLIFEGMLKAVELGAEAGATGVLVDEQFGSDIPARAKEHGLKLAMPVEKSGQNEFDFEYGADFGAHIEKFDDDFSKVLVRLNPDDPDVEMNERQIGRLKELADWLHAHDRKFLFELLVPATEAQLESVGGSAERYDAELRPELMRRAIEMAQNSGIEVDVWKIEGVGALRRGDARRAGALRTGARRRHLRAARAGRLDREGRGVARGGIPGRGLHRLRDRPLDLVGRAQGLPRLVALTRAGGGPDRRQLPPFRPRLRRPEGRLIRTRPAGLNRDGPGGGAP